MDISAVRGVVADEGTSNVLVTQRWPDPDSAAVCRALFDHRSSRPANVMLISVARSPAAWFESVGEALETEVREFAFVTADPDRRPATEGHRSVGDRSAAGGAVPSGAVAVDERVDPANLTDLGVAVTDRLETWGDRDARTAVCLHSVTPLLLYNPLEQVFHFLRIVANRVADAGATAHYHLDPAAHDDETVERLRPLFDRVLDVSDAR